MKLGLTNKELRDLELFILRRVESIIFLERKRPSGRQKVKGGLLIQDGKNGALRNKLMSAKDFIKETEKGFEIDIKMVEYFKYLDDARREELNWYITEAVFEDPQIRKKIKEITTKRVSIKILSELKIK